MKKIILSVAAATLMFSTVASALENIKVNGQAKLWYESNNIIYGTNGENEIGEKDSSVGEFVTKVGMTGTQGNVGFGAEVTKTSSLGLEGEIVSGTRSSNGLSNDAADDVETDSTYMSKAYVTTTVAPSTILKIGRQELDTPFAFTEKWNATQNNFDATVLVNNSVKNLSIIAAYVGKTNASLTGSTGFKAGSQTTMLHGGAYALGFAYKNGNYGANLWGYALNDVANGGDPANGSVDGSPANAYWLDISAKIAGISAKAIFAQATTDAQGITDETTTAYAVDLGYTVAGINLMAAYSTVSKGEIPIGNVATGFKKTKLPTAGVYTDGVYVAQPESDAFKVKVSTKLAGTSIALQYVDNTNDGDDGTGVKVVELDTTEVDLIVSRKVGDVNLKGLVINRAFDDSAFDKAYGATHVRVIASVNF